MDEGDYPCACERCGHSMDGHLVFGVGDNPTHGWMKCPVAGCDCKATWSTTSPEAAAIVEKSLDSAKPENNCG